MSATGVPSIASIAPILIRLSMIWRTVTWCNPSGFGLSGDRVEKTPVSGEISSPRGCTFSLSRCASCNHVIIMMSCPTAMPCSPSTKRGLTSSQASGAPSIPCRGASSRHFKSERMKPIGRTEYESGVVMVPCLLSVEFFSGKISKQRRCYFFFLLMSQSISEWMFRPILVML